MNAYLNREKMTKIAIPKGELLESFLLVMAKIGCELRPTSSGSLAYEMPFLSLPIIMLAMRARDVGRTVADPNGEIRYGFTGTDIIEEQGLTPILEVPSSMIENKSTVDIGSTPNWNEIVAKPKVSGLNALDRPIVTTPYPNITKRYLEKNGVQADVMERLGAIEGFWWGYKRNYADVDVRETGKTMSDNKVIPIDTVMEDITIGLVGRDTSESIYSEDREEIMRDKMVMFDFFERIRKGIQKKRK